MAVDGWRPLITWSRREFLTETVWEPTGLVVGGKLKMLRTNALAHREDLRPIMAPVVPLPSYPRLPRAARGERQAGTGPGVSSKYLYAIHPRTMAYLVRLWRETGPGADQRLAGRRQHDHPAGGQRHHRRLPGVPRPARVLPARPGQQRRRRHQRDLHAGRGRGLRRADHPVARAPPRRGCTSPPTCTTRSTPTSCSRTSASSTSSSRGGNGPGP